jgi:hypothetical protein
MVEKRKQKKNTNALLVMTGIDTKGETKKEKKTQHNTGTLLRPK